MISTEEHSGLAWKYFINKESGLINHEIPKQNVGMARAGDEPQGADVGPRVVATWQDNVCNVTHVKAHSAPRFQVVGLG